MNRAQREQCWDARDALFTCLDSTFRIDGHNIEPSDVKSPCDQLLSQFKNSCPETWARHFLEQRAIALARKKAGIKDLTTAINDGDIKVVMS
jgi:hypothetical protein